MDDISVHIKPSAVAGLRGGRSLDGGQTTQLLKVGQKWGIELEPVFPVASTPEQAGAYTVKGAEPSKVKEIIQELNECDAVENAFRVPPAELP